MLVGRSRYVPTLHAFVGLKVFFFFRVLKGSMDIEKKYMLEAYNMTIGYGRHIVFFFFLGKSSIFACELDLLSTYHSLRLA